MRALVTGATGFVGKRLLAELKQPIVLSRDPDRARKSLADFDVAAFHPWDSVSGLPPAEAFEGVDAVFHLAGEPVAGGRWTAQRKRRIRESRSVGTRNLVSCITKLNRKPEVLVSASAVGYYGSRGDEILTESTPPGSDFLADVCVEWEQAASLAVDSGVRVVTPRIGLILGQGGALRRMLLPFRAGIGGRLGNGRQWMPWIHIEDLIRLLMFAAETSSLQGAVNAVAPSPVTNREFTKALGHALHRPTIVPVPYLGLRLVFGEFAEVLFASQRAVPAAAERAGYTFSFTDVQEALNDLLSPDGAPGRIHGSSKQ